ncbi:hypothetical protein HDV02_006269 [Globomyces sp. JEL0801]|nr:hypothetical protein HDV02_006269 [Globomyces sp. JEL0801]
MADGYLSDNEYKLKNNIVNMVKVSKPTEETFFQNPQKGKFKLTTKLSREVVTPVGMIFGLSIYQLILAYSILLSKGLRNHQAIRWNLILLTLIILSLNFIFQVITFDFFVRPYKNSLINLFSSLDFTFEGFSIVSLTLMKLKQYFTFNGSRTTFGALVVLGTIVIGVKGYSSYLGLERGVAGLHGTHKRFNVFRLFQGLSIITGSIFSICISLSFLVHILNEKKMTIRNIIFNTNKICIRLLFSICMEIVVILLSISFIIFENEISQLSKYIPLFTHSMDMLTIVKLNYGFKNDLDYDDLENPFKSLSRSNTIESTKSNTTLIKKSSPKV